MTTPTAADPDAWDVEDNSNYELLRLFTLIDEVHFERRPAPERSITFTFVRHDSTPETDSSLVVTCSHSNPGVHVIGDVPHDLSTYPYEDTDTVPTIVTFAESVNIKVFTHRDRTKEVALKAEKV